MITTIPAESYVKDGNGVNVTLQTAARIIVDSFQRCATTGIPVHDLASEGGLCVPGLQSSVHVLLVPCKT